MVIQHMLKKWREFGGDSPTSTATFHLTTPDNRHPILFLPRKSLDSSPYRPLYLDHHDYISKLYDYHLERAIV